MTSEPGIGLIVAGSVAVSRRGARAGKGEGYADMEYALLRELGLNETPVVTTVHPAQIVHDFAVDSHDLSVDIIVTPHEAIETHTPYPKPSGIDWNLLTSEDLAGHARPCPLARAPVGKPDHPGHRGSGTQDPLCRHQSREKKRGGGPQLRRPWKPLLAASLRRGPHPGEVPARRGGKLLKHGLGITNVVSRASRSEADLSWKELSEGGRALRKR